MERYKSISETSIIYIYIKGGIHFALTFNYKIIVTNWGKRGKGEWVYPCPLPSLYVIFQTKWIFNLFFLY